MPGRPPKSARQHKLEGTYQKCRHEGRGVSLDPITAAPPCPETVKGKKARSRWADIVPALVSARLVTPADFDTLEQAFIALDMANDLQGAIERDGGIVGYYANWEGRKDFVFEWHRQVELYNKIMWKFGVTPVEAGKIRGAPKDESLDTSAVANIIGKI